MIQEMHERLSGESLYYRYLGLNKPSIEDLQRLCSIDGGGGMALVATVEEPEKKVIAIAYYRVDPKNPSTAEPAVLVEDSYQGRGLGKQIIFALCQKAVQKGLETFDTFIHPANYRMLSMIKGSGLNFESRYSDGLKEVRVWLSRT
jgi:RimJ/RimL family protein N-acetyltransferase